VTAIYSVYTFSKLNDQRIANSCLGSLCDVDVAAAAAATDIHLRPHHVVLRIDVYLVGTAAESVA